MREYIALFCAETQPAELAALREVALQWMERLAPLRPYLTGAVWRGTATRLNPVRLQLYCDDPKAAEIALLDLRRALRRGDNARPARPAGRRAARAGAERGARRARRRAPHRARPRRPARRAQARCARTQRARRCCGAAPPAGRRTRDDEPAPPRARRGRRGLGRRPAATGPAGAPRRPTPSSASGQRSSRRPTAARWRLRLPRPAAGAQFLGHLVRALRARDADARSLPAPVRHRPAGRSSGWPSTAPRR